MKRHADLLTHVSVFQGLSAGDRADLAGRMKERSFKENETIFEKGDRGTSMYVVLSGAVQVSLPAPPPGGRPIVLKQLHAGDYFGELALFGDGGRSASATAVLDTVLLELTHEDVGDVIGRSKAAAMAILGDMADRLRELTDMLAAPAAKNASKEVDENLTWGQRLADRVATLNGSWTFILILLGLTVVWCTTNSAIHPFDPFPYVLYNLVLAILVAPQGPLIVMSQNRQSAKDRAQAEADYRVNLKNEIGIERLHAMVAALRAETTKRTDGRAEPPAARPEA